MEQLTKKYKARGIFYRTLTVVEISFSTDTAFVENRFKYTNVSRLEIFNFVNNFLVI